MSTPAGQPFDRKVLDENWTATVKIKGAKSVKIANERGYFDAGPLDMESGTTTFEVTARSLADLQRKVVAHVGLLEDDMKEGQ